MRIDSILTNDGVLPLLSALVVVIVLRWAISSPVWRIMEEADQPPAPHPAQATSLRSPPAAARPPARIVPPGRPVARHATTTLVRPPQVTGAPPWGPAPKPPGLP